jgi:hypothetical protein
MAKHVLLRPDIFPSPLVAVSKERLTTTKLSILHGDKLLLLSKSRGVVSEREAKLTHISSGNAPH